MPQEIKYALQRLVTWTKLKCRIQDGSSEPPYFSEREIWWAHLGENLGSEQNGKNELFDRPVLIVKKLSIDLLWVLPLTTTEKVGKYYFPTAHQAGQKTAKVVLTQIRTISSKRLIRKQRTMPVVEFDSVRASLRALLL